MTPGTLRTLDTAILIAMAALVARMIWSTGYPEPARWVLIGGLALVVLDTLRWMWRVR